MNPKTLTALRESIAKWEANAKAKWATDVKLSATDCPLCQLFHNDFTAQENSCRGCPVRLKTGQRYCKGAPYEDVIHEREKVSYRMSPELLAAIDAEIDFLKSLLPEGVK